MRLESKIRRLEDKLHSINRQTRIFDLLNPRDVQEVLSKPEEEVIRVNYSYLAAMREALGGEVDWERALKQSHLMSVSDAREIIKLLSGLDISGL